MSLSATGIMTETATGTGIMIATEIAVTTITTEFIAIGMEIATTAEFIGTAIETATEDITAGTGDMTDAMIAVATATTGVGMDGAGPIGTAATGFTKFLRNDVSSF